MPRSVIAFLVGLALCATTAAADDDPIKTKLGTAKKDYDTKLEKYKKGVTDWLDKKEETARKAGNKELVDQIKLAREIYQDTGTLPVVPPPDVQKTLTGAQTVYDAALIAAVKDYTKAKKDEEAAAITKQLQEFREEIDPRTPVKKALLGTWKVTVASEKYTGEWTFNNDGSVNSTKGVAKGQWSIDVNRRAVLIGWGKDLTDKFDLPLNPNGTVGSQVGRQNAKLEAVKKP